MSSGSRKHYIDNLRWLILLVLIPYHAAMAWNVWGEPNYINFEGSRAISSIVVFFSPFFMPLLFTLAGVSTRFALQKRTKKEYIAERAKRLLIPFLFGTLLLMPVMTYIADVFNNGYQGSFFAHYAVFFTKFTDLTGADGGFSLGQFWFLFYLFVISLIGIAVITLVKKIRKSEKTMPFFAVLLLGFALPLLSEVLSIGGKSLAEYAYLFLLGYYVFADDTVIEKTEKSRWLLLGVGLAASVLDVYLFIWCDKEYSVLNTAAKYIAEWFMLLALFGMAKRYLDFTGKLSSYMSRRSFLYYIYHFICVVVSQFLLYKLFPGRTVILYLGTVVLSCIFTFVLCEISLRIQPLCFLTGAKYNGGRTEK